MKTDFNCDCYHNKQFGSNINIRTIVKHRPQRTFIDSLFLKNAKSQILIYLRSSYEFVDFLLGTIYTNKLECDYEAKLLFRILSRIGMLDSMNRR
jgi:hypothetical protein